MTTCQVFRGRTLTEARRAAVQALGGGAVLLTTREVRSPGLAGLLGTREVGTQIMNRVRRDDLDARFPGLLDAVLNAAPPLRI